MDKSNFNVLFIDDNEDVLVAAKLLLKPHISNIHTEQNPENIPNLIRNENYDVIFLDMNFTQDMTSGQEGFFWLEKILEINPQAIVILITAYGDVDMAVKAVKAGATDFVLKPWQNEKFLATFSSAIRLRESKLELDSLKEKQHQINLDNNKNYPDLIGNSNEMRAVFKTIEKVAKTDANIFILGENGTGKELVARALHNSSNRAGEAFVSVDMGAITSSLFESELFGHVKGAFTDAKEDRPGRFEIASGGTLFLDEIGNLPVELQIKLLTVLQNREVSRVGSNVKREFDVRLICATNMPIQKMINENSFRQDLLYRINTVEIDLPPLRNRSGDIELLTNYFLEKFKTKYQKPDLRINELTYKKLAGYNWPGNVRELQHAIERAVILTDSNILQPKDFFFSGDDTSSDEMSLENYNLENIEKMIIRKVLTKYEGNITKAADELGLTRTSLYRRIEKYGI